MTEAVMRALLVDFKTAEAIKQQILPDGADIQFTDILGIKQSITCEELINIIQESMRQLSNEIAKQILAINDGPPSALFLAGGGSKLYGLRKRMAECLEMDERRVAIAGNNFEKSAFSEELDLENPEYATPLGIAVSAGMGLINDSYVVLLNGQPAKLFRNGLLTLRDILLMNGYTYGDILGKTGRGLTVTLNGKRLVFRGEPATPSVLKVNGEEAPITTVVHAGDQITFTPAKPGMDVQKTPKELLREDFNGRVFINGEEAALDTPLNQGDTILTLNGRDAVPPKAPPPPPQPVPVIPAAPVRHTARQAAVSTAQTQPAAPSAQSVVPPVNQVQSAPPADPVQSVVQPTAPPAAPVQSALLRGIQVVLNGTSLVLPPKQDGMPYYLMDLLQFSGLDFDHLERPVVLKVNGQEGRFQDILRNRDTVDIHMI
ncbi:MAG: hypothetical protein HFE97_07355 [Oscillospiraceae bacterium]|nr:hypothetical protein [Oscillospiraceae bacterium]